jgi:hypothetical protein
MLIAFFPVVMALVGLVLYALGNGKTAEIGRLLFVTGALVTLMTVARGTVRLL